MPLSHAVSPPCPRSCAHAPHCARRQYAIKKILLDAHSPHAYARIMREVTTLSRLQHPNVVRYFQVPGHEGRPCE